MKILHNFGLAIAGCILVVPLGFAQTSSSGSTTAHQALAKQHAEGGVSSAGGSSQYSNGAHKQATQGLPLGLRPDSSAPWSNQNKSGSHQ
jgi:phage-related minor tail protein